MPNPAASTERLLKILFSFMLSSLGIYWIVAQTFHPSTRINPLVSSGLTAVAALAAIVVYYLRFVRVEKLLSGTAAELGGQNPARLRVTYIVSYALCDVVGLCGFVLYAMGGGRSKATLFFLASAGLFLLCYPRLSKRSDGTRGGVRL